MATAAVAADEPVISAYPTTAANAGVITRKQAAIWIPIIFAIISILSVYALYAIDDVKSRDTILYAKFLANLKDRWSMATSSSQEYQIHTRLSMHIACN